MDKEAYRQAWDRLNRAKGAYSRILAAPSLSAFDEAWSDFLLAAHGFYSKLEKGCKGHPKAEPWFGGVKNERKTGPLLRYVHHARNADEHGIKRVTKHTPARIGIGAQGAVHIKTMRIENGQITHLDATPASPGSTLLIDHIPDRIELVEVHDDLHKDSFPVPTEHLGKPLSNTSPHAVAALTLAYLEGLIKKSAEFM